MSNFEGPCGVLLAHTALSRSTLSDYAIFFRTGNGLNVSGDRLKDIGGVRRCRLLFDPHPFGR